MNIQFSIFDYAAALAFLFLADLNPEIAVLYSILQRPPWATTVCLGLQQYLTMLGSTVLIPFIVSFLIPRKTRLVQLEQSPLSQPFLCKTLNI